MNNTNPSAPYFDKVATDWDVMRTGYFTEAVREAAIQKANLKTDSVAADVGAGTGFIAKGLAPLVKKVHVIDGSPEMIEVAKKNLSGFENIEFHVADGLQLPVQDGTVDAALANMYLHHCPDPLGAIQAMVKMLKPGGRLVITDMDTHTHEWLKTEMSDVWLGFERSKIKQWFEETGLKNVDVDCTGQSCQSDCASGVGDHADISIFVASGTR